MNYIRSPPYPPPLLSVKLFGHIQQEARRGRKNKKVSAAGKKKTPATEKEALLNISWPISLAASAMESLLFRSSSSTSRGKCITQTLSLLIIIIIMKSFISDPEQVRVTFFQSYIH